MKHVQRSVLCPWTYVWKRFFHDGKSFIWFNLGGRLLLPVSLSLIRRFWRLWLWLDTKAHWLGLIDGCGTILFAQSAAVTNSWLFRESKLQSHGLVQLILIKYKYQTYTPQTVKCKNRYELKDATCSKDQYLFEWSTRFERSLLSFEQRLRRIDFERLTIRRILIFRKMISKDSPYVSNTGLERWHLFEESTVFEGSLLMARTITSKDNLERFTQHEGSLSFVMNSNSKDVSIEKIPWLEG